VRLTRLFDLLVDPALVNATATVRFRHLAADLEHVTTASTLRMTAVGRATLHQRRQPERQSVALSE